MRTEIRMACYGALLALLLSACTPNAAYRTDTRLCTSEDAVGIIDQCAQNALQALSSDEPDTGSYTLGFIEFDDQGQIQEPRQFNAVRSLLKDIVSQENVILLVFVHGWKHNAHAGPGPGEEDNNITRFREVLGSVSLTERLQNPGAPRKVVGIYLGWRGLSATLPGIKQLTFWERKNTAHKVGAGAISEVLLTLEALVSAPDRRRGFGGGETPKSRFIVIGHSFGGAVVYSAVQQVLLERFIGSSCIDDTHCSARGFGDLVVLMNPAFEAMRYATLRSTFDLAGGYADGHLPVLAILTSEKDQATKVLFPAGRRFSTLFEKERKELDQGRKNRTAIGHYAPYQTHRLDPVKTDTGSPKLTFSIADQLETFLRFSEQWDKPEAIDIVLPGSGVRLSKTGSTHRFDPYLSIYVDGDLIPDHNAIYDPRVTEFIRQLIMLSIQDDDAKIRAMHQNSLRKSIDRLRQPRTD